MMKISPLSFTTLLSTLVLLGSLSSSTTISPVVVEAASGSGDDDNCGTLQSELVVSVRNDIFGNDETEWVLEKQDDDDDGTWIEAGGNALDRRNRLYVDAICLEPDAVYRWTATDLHGDGLFGDDPPISLTVNGDVVLDGDDHPRFWSLIELTFVTPSDPANGDGSVVILTNDPSGSPSFSPSESFLPSATVLPSGSPSKSSVPSGSPSESSVPSGSPTPLPCEGGDRQSRLTVYVTTDYFYYETTWLLEMLLSNDQSWVTVESNDLCQRHFRFDDTFCLEPDSTYRWSITDTHGDGIASNDTISLVLNGEEVYDEPYSDWYYLEHVFVTPYDPRSPSPSEVPSVSSLPTGTPMFLPCENEDEDVLIVEVTTDAEYGQTGWHLDLKDEDTGEFETVAAATDSFGEAFTSYVDNLCLIPGRSYKWTLTDDGGDGLNCDDPGDECGYHVALNGETIVETGEFSDKVVKEIGPVECVDEEGLHRAYDPENTDTVYDVGCNRFSGYLRQNGDASRCNFPLSDGSGYFYEKCKNACGSEGFGPCPAV